MRRILGIILTFIFALGIPGLLEIVAYADEVQTQSFMVDDLTVNDNVEPLGLDIDNIRFGWKNKSSGRGKKQTHYQIIVSEGEKIIWDSGKTESTSTYGIEFTGDILSEKTRYDWSVKVWDESGNTATKSSFFETGIADWSGIDWIGGAGVKLLKKVYSLSKQTQDISRARVYISGEGLFELRINGKKVGDYVLTPPPTQYYSRAYYITYDVEEYLKKDDNVFGILLGSGNKGKYYDNIYLARMLLEITYSDGTVEQMVTNDSSGWAQSYESPITRDSYYHGEDQDTTFYEGWDTEPTINLGNGLWRESSFDGYRTVDIENEILSIHSNTAQNSLLNGEYENFVLETRIKMDDTSNSDPAIGLIFGYQNETNYHMWQINYLYGSVRPHTYQNGAWVGLASSSFDNLTKLGEWFDLKIQVFDDTVKTYINGNLVNTTTGILNVKGGIGFRFIGGLGDAAKGETIHLDELKITEDETTLLNHDFKSMPQQWTEAQVFDGNIFTKEGKLCLLASNAFTRNEFSDFSFQADITVLDTGNDKCFGLYFRKGEGNNGYMWQVNLPLMQLRGHTLINGAWNVSEIADLPAGISVDKSFNFKLEAVGNTFKTYINGVLISEYTDVKSSFSSGRIGFRLESGENNVVDNVVITDATGETLLQDEFETLDSSVSSPWIFPARFSPTMTALNTFTVINAIYESKSFREVSSKKYLVDFGQNMSGWVRLTVQGERGTKIKVSYAEHLSADGNDINGDTLSGRVMESGSDVYNTYVLNGKAQVLQPLFNYTGFQYCTVEVLGGECEITAEDVVACFITEKMEQVGEFESSSDVINGVMEMYLAGQRSNTVGNFTDCPHREKAGWLGDAHVTCEAISYIFDGYRLYEKFLLDMKDNTYNGDLTWDDGVVRVFVPHVPTGDHSLADPPWQSGRFIILWDVYRATGDKSLIETNYDSAKSTLEYFRTLQVSDSDFTITANAFGDWLGFDNRNGLVNKAFLSTAYYYQSAKLFVEMAKVIGKTEDAVTYSILAENIKSALNKNWLKNNSYYDMNTQSSNSIALAFGFVPETAKQNVVNSLVKNIEECGYVLKTGTLASKTIFTALAEAGRSDVVLKLAMQTKYPSFGYMYENGATTLWEYWEPYGYAMQFSPDKQSLNHNMYGGGFATWCYQGLAGIINEGIAWDKIKIMPANNTGVFEVSASTDTVRGQVASAWKNTQEKYTLNVEIPVGATATVYVPNHNRENAVVKESGQTIYENGEGKNLNGLTFIGYEEDYFIYQCGSGSYSFEVIGELTETLNVEDFDISVYKSIGNRFNNSITITEITGRTNHWKISNDGTLSISTADTEYMAKFNGIDVGTEDFVYSGNLTFDKMGEDSWDGARIVIGYESPIEFEVIDFRRGGIFYTKRTNDVSAGWLNHTIAPYLFKQGEEYEFVIKVIDDKLYVEINGERIINGYSMPENRCTNGFGVYNSKSAFTIENLVISEIEAVYKISFNVNGGEPIADMEYTSKSESIILPTLKREHYTFGGWYEDSAFTQKVENISVNAGKNYELHAQWIPDTYTVSFYANGGTTVSDQTVAYNGKAAKPSDPVQEGYTFGGWYLDVACTQAYDFDSAVTDNVGLYAKWTENVPTENDSGCAGTIEMLPICGLLVVALGCVLVKRKSKDQ